MPANGLTQRTIGRITGRHFKDQAQIYRWKGVSSAEVPIWEDLGQFNSKLIDKSGVTFLADGSSQAYDAKIIIVGGISVTEPNEKYRVVLTQTKTAVEAEGDDPEVKRTRYYEIVNVDVTGDNVGTDIFQTLRVKGSEAPGALA